MEEKISGPVGGGQAVALTDALKLKGTFDLIGESFKIFGKWWKVMILIQLIPGILALAFGFISSLLEEGAAIGWIIAFIILVIPVIFLGMWGLYSLIVAVARSGQGEEKKGWKNYYGESIKIFWGILGVTILTALATIGGFFLLIVPGFIFGVWFTFAVWVYMEKGKGSGLVNAMRESKRIVKGYFWSIVWRNLVFGFLISAVIIPVTFVLLAITVGISAIPGMTQPVAEFLNGVLQWPVQAVATSISLIFTFLLYKNIKGLKEKGKEKQALATWVKVVAPIVVVLMLVVPIGLSILGVTALSKAREKARDATRMTELKQIEMVLKLYQMENGVYPNNLSELGERLPADVLMDPGTNDMYDYEVFAGGVGFEVCAELEVEGEKSPYCVGSE